MLSPIVDHAAERDVDTHRMTSSSSTNTPFGADLLHGPDPSIHMLGLPKSYPHLGRWIALAIIVGAVAAFLLVAIAGS